MHPRYRRALIPALLVLLLVVVVVASFVDNARADGGSDRGAEPKPGHHERVSQIEDPLVAESSGLAISTRDPGIAYTINDSGNEPIVFSVEIATGKVVGKTRLRGYEIRDAEALTIRDNRLWVGDIGNNAGERDDLALYALPQPRRGDHIVRPRRYPVFYAGSAREDAETLLADPRTGRMYVVSKGFVGGGFFALPKELRRDHDNEMKPVPGVNVPLMVTDGAFLPDGSGFVLRSYISAYVYDAKTRKRDWTTTLPEHRQGETLAVEPGGRSILVGSEKLPSPIDRVTLGGKVVESGRSLADVGGVVSAAA